MSWSPIKFAPPGATKPTARASDNNYPGDPPRMSDGRFAGTAAWASPGTHAYDQRVTPARALPPARRADLGSAVSNLDYRRYLTEHGLAACATNAALAHAQVGVSDFTIGERAAPTGRYLFTSAHDNTVPYGYESSNMKQHFIAREQMRTQSTYTPFVLAREVAL